MTSRCDETEWSPAVPAKPTFEVSKAEVIGTDVAERIDGIDGDLDAKALVRSARWGVPHAWLPASLLLAVGCAEPTPAPVRGETLAVITAGTHDRAAYTQGLIYHDGVFFESTGRYGASSVRRVDAETGGVLGRHDLDRRYFAEGLTHLNDLLYQLTWREGVGFIYASATLEPVGTFQYEGEGWGLTTDGMSLIMSDGTHRLRFLDPETFQVTRTIEVTDEGRAVYALNELEWIEGEIWANIWRKDDIARIDPATGVVRGWVNVRGLLSPWDRWRGAEVANGIAYDSVSGRLWVTGKNWPRVFEVRRPE